MLYTLTCSLQSLVEVALQLRYLENFGKASPAVFGIKGFSKLATSSATQMLKILE